MPFRRIIGGFLIYISALYIRSYSREFPFARPFFYGPFLRLFHGRGIRAFPEFSVSDGNALLAEVNGVRIEPLAVPLPDADAYFFAVAGGRKP